MAGTILAGVGLATVSSCRPTIPDNTFVCAQDAECPEGQTCILERCRTGWQCNDLCGDANQDGVVDPLDRTLVEALGTNADACGAVTDAPTLCQCNAADIDGNGDIDALDLAAFDDGALTCRFTDPLVAPEFCVPHLLEPPGRVVVQGDFILDAAQGLTWIGDRFVTVYLATGDATARSLELDGTAGPATHLASASGSLRSLVGSNGHAAALFSAGAERTLLILDETGAEVATVPVGDQAVPIAFRDAFALLEDGTLTPLALDGTVGTPDQLSAEAAGFSAVESRAFGRLAFVHGEVGPCGDLTFSVVDSDTFAPVGPPDVQRGGVEADPLRWFPEALAVSDDRYLLFMEATTYDSCDPSSSLLGSSADLVKVYDADGLPLTEPLPVGLEQIPSELVATDRYLMFYDARGATYSLFDRAGRLYSTAGPAAEHVFRIDRESSIQTMGVAAHSADGVGVVYARHLGDLDEELVFTTWGCDG